MTKRIMTDDQTITIFSLIEEDMEAHSLDELAVGYDGATSAMQELIANGLSLGGQMSQWRLDGLKTLAERLESYVGYQQEAKDAGDAKFSPKHLADGIRRATNARHDYDRAEFIVEFLGAHDDISADTPVPEDPRLEGLFRAEEDHIALNLFYGFLYDLDGWSFDHWVPTIHGR